MNVFRVGDIVKSMITGSAGIVTKVNERCQHIDVFFILCRKPTSGRDQKYLSSKYYTRVSRVKEDDETG